MNDTNNTFLGGDFAEAFADIFATAKKEDAPVVKKSSYEIARDELIEAIKENIELHNDGYNHWVDFVVAMERSDNYAVEVLTDGEVLEKFIKFVEVAL